MKRLANKEIKKILNAHHSDEFKKKMINRFHRIEGQIKGIEKMITEDVYCDDVLIQISAVQSALSSAALSLLEAHLRTCVTEQIKADNDEKAIDELVSSLKKMLRKG